MYACICAAITTTQVRASILAGALTVDEIGEHCGAGTGCGSCVKRLGRMLEEAESRGEASPGEALPRSA
ncbi:bacterioferritin-associated ferredoxin [Halopolyspora algeriensis]|uniref:Bacterioferritin-associated ferredoxin n=1 Tax=Halopolyspora algeriensis TaxID=1500506 RepID=A0A368VTH3_9ACTN|nr:(2Fe-2S)-binding protein [Halopolyspora algeriensis]RCW45045.1 bacterioferritin-associated ferredoxin [Halopolyspora algeriensis]TQM53230.1 bacterioferritin-associated ferredoxin [Halopolyspora algeriensis]